MACARALNEPALSPDRHQARIATSSRSVDAQGTFDHKAFERNARIPRSECAHADDRPRPRRDAMHDVCQARRIAVMKHGIEHDGLRSPVARDGHRLLHLEPATLRADFVRPHPRARSPCCPQRARPPVARAGRLPHRPGTTRIRAAAACRRCARRSGRTACANCPRARVRRSVGTALPMHRGSSCWPIAPVPTSAECDATSLVVGDALPGSASAMARTSTSSGRFDSMRYM
jgi:hypothetical protein